MKYGNYISILRYLDGSKEVRHQKRIDMSKWKVQSVLRINVLWIDTLYLKIEISISYWDYIVPLGLFGRILRFHKTTNQWHAIIFCTISIFPKIKSKIHFWSFFLVCQSEQFCSLLIKILLFSLFHRLLIKNVSCIFSNAIKSTRKVYSNTSELEYGWKLKLSRVLYHPISF